MLTITATGRYSKCVSNEVITAGSVGIPAVFNLNEDFDGLSPIAVFRGSGVSFDVALIGSEVIVPHEVLTNVGGILEVGVYARNGEGTIVIPTVWSVAGTIREGAIASGVDPSEPTPDWTAQVQAAASEAVQTANDAKDIAENAKEVAITSADSAQKSAVSANNSAARSSAAANAADRARDSAERYRDDTLTYSMMADESANSARTYAQNAETSARDASNSADVATQKAATASEAAANAARSEENAFNSAREATDASNNAEQAAEQASLSAGRADESSQNAAESARLAVLSEAAASTSALTANEAKIASETAQSEAEAAKVATETAKNRSEELYDYITEAKRSATEAAASAVAAKTDAEIAAESATESAAVVQEVAERLPAIEENLDIAKTTANDARITLFDGTPLVDYAVRDLNYTGTPGTADSTCLGVKRRGSRIVLNGGNISNESRPTAFVKLTGNTTGRTNNSLTVRAWPDGIVLKNGRTYRVTVIYISGETTSENAPPAVTVSVYNLGESSTIGYGKKDENNRYIRYFKPTGELNLALYVPCYQVTYTDYTVDVILEEVDETVGEHLPSMMTNKALAINDFVIVDNELFRITTPVVSGGTLIPGTNCEKVTITEALSKQIDETNELKDDIDDTQSMIATVEADSTANKEYAVGDLLVFEGKLYQAVSAISLGDTLIPNGNIELTTVEQQLATSGGGAVDDVQINGTSIVDAQGVASIPIASSSRLGAVKVNADRGIFLIWGDTLQIAAASSPNVKTGTNPFQPIVPMQQHESAFYGLAKAAGSDEKNSTLPVGQYTDEAKSAIQNMLNVPDKSQLDAKIPNITYGEPEVVLEETTLNFAKDGDNAWFISGVNPIPGITFSENTLYKVMWDGVEYECFCVEGHLRSSTGVGTYPFNTIGNLSVIGQDNRYEIDAPFLIAQRYKQTETTNVYVLTTSTGASHTVKVTVVPFTKTIVEKQYYEETSDGSPVIVAGSGKGSAMIGFPASSTGQNALAIGEVTVASGNASFSSGLNSEATAMAAHAEGITTVASGQGAHAEGQQTVASGGRSHAEGRGTIASGAYSHAEGYETTASGSVSHASGRGSVALGAYSHVEGEFTIASHRDQRVFGTYNKVDPSTAVATANGTYIEIAGNGTSDEDRSNARTLDWSGNEKLAGDLTIHAGGANEKKVGDALDALTDDVDALQDDVNSKATAIYETVGPASVVSFTDGADNAPIELLTAILCDQNLHGYDHPWAAGHGINMLPPVCNNSDFTLDENGAYSQNNTSSAGWSWTYSRNVVNVTVQPGTYTVSFHAITIADDRAAELRVFTSTESQLKTISGSNKQSGSATFTVDAETTIGICIKCYKGVWKLQLEEGSTVSDWTPYENVCPMAGNTSIDISVSGADTTTPTVTHITFVDPETEDPITVYSGTLTVNEDGSAELAALPHYASYNGETLVGPWVSSMDVYAEGATPTTGAEVVDLGGVATVYQLTAEQIRTMGGVNNIWSDAGDVTAIYPADTKSYIDAQAAQPKTVTVTGTTPVIAALPGISYKCGEVATLDIALPASGCIDVIFESGSTPTVLTVTPPTGVTLRWANGFDPTNIAQNTTYEINILDGLGVACTWM